MNLSFAKQDDQALPLLRIILTAFLLTLLAFNTGCHHLSAAKEPILEGIAGEALNAIDRKTSAPPQEWSCDGNTGWCEKREGPGGKDPLFYATVDATVAVISSIQEEQEQQRRQRQRETVTNYRYRICDDNGNCREVEAINETQPAFTVLDEATD